MKIVEKEKRKLREEGTRKNRKEEKKIRSGPVDRSEPASPVRWDPATARPALP